MSTQRNDKRKVFDRINLRRRRINTTEPANNDAVHTFYITVTDMVLDMDMPSFLLNLFPLIERLRESSGTSSLLNIILYLYPVNPRNVLSRKELSRIRKKISQRNGDPCSICLDNIKKNDVLRVLNCRHEFHCKCVDKWLLTSSSCCPICRKPAILKTK